MKLMLHLLLVYSCGALFHFLSPMSCSYGPRGSLTAICVNASQDYFRITNYRFDYLDETLLCLNCTLTELQQGTFDIPGNEIKTLDIRNSSVSIVWPRAFLGMIYMQTLLLSDNNITRIYPGAFDGARKVKRLEMNNALVNFDFTGAFNGLHLLEVLSLNHNSLETIEPGAFEDLHSLKVLDLSYNRLKTVKDIFEPLVNLKVLRLEHNSIRNLNGGNEFHTLRSLLLLNLEFNQMYNFSINLPDGNDLRSLRLAYNHLNDKSFQKKAFDNLNNLEHLDLRTNEFEGTIPVKFFQGLYKLIEMDLSDNKLTAINTGTFTGLPHLRRLNLSSNLIEDLKITGRFSLPGLVELDLAKNRIVDFDYMSLVRRTPKLRLIDLRRNRLSCGTAGQLRVLFRNDAVRYLLDGAAPTDACPEFAPVDADELIARNVQDMGYRSPNGAFLVWMFVLLTVAILLVGLLFYVQFFNVLRIGPSRGIFHGVRLGRTRPDLQG